MLHNNSIFYRWSVSEFEFKEKNKQWFWIVGLVALSLIVLSVFLENYLLGFLILLGTFLMFTQANKQPLELSIEISEEGIRIKDNMHRYEEISAFWMKETDDEEVKLILLTSEAMTPIESIMVPSDIDPMELREFLLSYIQEEEVRESYTERFMKIIGF